MHQLLLVLPVSVVVVLFFVPALVLVEVLLEPAPPEEECHGRGKHGCYDPDCDDRHLWVQLHLVHYGEGVGVVPLSVRVPVDPFAGVVWERVFGVYDPVVVVVWVKCLAWEVAVALVGDLGGSYRRGLAHGLR